MIGAHLHYLSQLLFLNNQVNVLTNDWCSVQFTVLYKNKITGPFMQCSCTFLIGCGDQNNTYMLFEEHRCTALCRHRFAKLPRRRVLPEHASFSNRGSSVSRGLVWSSLTWTACSSQSSIASSLSLLFPLFQLFGLDATGEIVPLIKLTSPSASPFLLFSFPTLRARGCDN